ncbi:MAG: M56 family metallopeptidase, partial [Firmicutes bacterium]|nr:M56 family metallopeptidase [Bacillota bacterium]
MSRLLLGVLNQSLVASYAVLVVLVVRTCLRRRPKHVSYWLWLVVLLRLLCPVALPSPWSLVPPGLHIPVGQAPLVESPALPGQPPLAPDSSAILSSEAAVTGAFVIWIGGALLLLGYGVIAAGRLRRQLATATLIRDNIYETDLIQTPFVFGLLAPRIYLPTHLSASQRQHVILHEQTHIRRLDHLVRHAGFFALALHWFNPLIWLAYSLMIKDMEMACDESVLRQAEGDIRVDYSNSLLSISARQSGLPNLLAFGERNVTSRIRNVLNYRRPQRWVLAAVCLVVIAVAIGLLANPLGTVTYQDDQIGYSLTLPRSFTRQVDMREEVVSDTLRILYFVYKPIQAMEPRFIYGVVGRVEIYSKAEHTEAVLEDHQLLYGLELVGENSKYYFCIARPTDVQVPPNASEKLQSR